MSISKIIKNFIPLFTIKWLLTFRVYFNIFPGFIGFYYALTARKLEHIFYPLLIMCTIGGVILIYQEAWRSLLHLGFVVSLFFFATWMIHTLTDRDIENIAIKIVLLCAILLLFEWLAIGYNTTRARSFFGIPMQRLIGIGGDPNFTALILSGCSLILIYHRRYLYVAIALIGIFLTASRSAFLPLLYYGLIFIIGKRLRYLSFKIYDIGLVIFLMTPLIILINHWLFATTVYENGYLR